MRQPDYYRLILLIIWEKEEVSLIQEPYPTFNNKCMKLGRCLFVFQSYQNTLTGDQKLLKMQSNNLSKNLQFKFNKNQDN